MARRSLDGCRVLITGASSGIGRELALALCRRRAKVLLSARRAELMDAVATECTSLGGTAERLAGDVTDAAYRDELLKLAVTKLGGLDVLVNNAGVSAHGRFEDGDEATTRRIMEVNYFAAVELTRQAIPLLRSGNKPAIVNIGSILGHRAAPLNSEYSASKFALRGWSEALRAELAGDGIDVLLVSPGTTDTEFFDHLLVKRDELPWGRVKGIPAAVVAEQILRALGRGRREIFPNWRGRALVIANRLFPGLVDRAMAKLASRRSK
jgi:short-subunit dehydrogenase